MPTISIVWKRISLLTLAAHPFTEPCRCLREFCWCLIQLEHLSSGFGVASKSRLPRPYLGRVRLRDQNFIFFFASFLNSVNWPQILHMIVCSNNHTKYTWMVAHRWPHAFVGFGGLELRLGAGWGCSAQMIFSNDA